MRRILPSSSTLNEPVDAARAERYASSPVSTAHDEKRCMGGRFVIEREVGRGGVGVVYRAWDLVTEQYVALKVIAAEAGVSPDEEARLSREGELLSHLDHPGI